MLGADRFGLEHLAVDHVHDLHVLTEALGLLQAHLRLHVVVLGVVNDPTGRDLGGALPRAWADRTAVTLGGQERSQRNEAENTGRQETHAFLWR